MSEENKQENENTLNEVPDGMVLAENSRESIYCMCIVGQIEGHYLAGENQKSTKYEHILPQLVQIEESEETDGLLVLLNTVGGDVEAGLAIAEMISGMTKPTVSLILGGSHSIGVPLAVAAKKSFIAPSATMTIHPVRMNGLVIGVEQAFAHFTKMQNRIVDFIIRNSNVNEKVFRDLMLETDQLVADVGTIIDGEKAVDIGLIDGIGGLSQALGALKEMTKKKA
jgi:ATP-dependent protease ClpP protease subunit